MTVLETMTTNPPSVRFRNSLFFCGAKGLRALRDLILFCWRFILTINSLSFATTLE